MEKTLIRVDCIDQRLYISTAPTLASGGRNEDEIEFSFCALWDGFEKAAVFYRDKENIYHAAVSENRCIIPHEVLADGGWMHFGVFGVKGDITRTSEIMRYRVTEGAITEGTAPSDPTPDIYAQMLDSLADLSNRVGALEKIGGVDGEIDLSDYALKSDIPEPYVLPTASAEIMGGVKIGGGLSIDENGVLKTSAPIFIIEEPEDTSAYDGEEATVTVKAIGEGLTYDWYYKNPDMTSFNASAAYKNKDFCTIEMTAARDGRQVYCIITDAYGNALRTRTATLTLEELEVGAAEAYMPYFTVGEGLVLENGVMSAEPEGVYELIETVTLNGESAINLTHEANGTPYNFSDILVEIETSANSDVAGHVYPNIYCGETVVAAYGLGNGIAVNSKRFMATGATVNKGVAETFATSVGQDFTSATKLYRRPRTDFTKTNITGVYVSASVPFPEGTKIMIKGVRANA